MSESSSAQRKTDDGESDLQERVPLTARLLLRHSLTARRAAAIIAGFTFLVTVGRGLLERVLDPKGYPTVGRGLSFALQTVPTLGYGDVTASLVESGRPRFAPGADTDVNQRLDQVNERLAPIEAARTPARSGGSADGIS